MRTLIFRGYFAGVSVSPAAENAFLYSPRQYMRRRTPYPNEDPGSPTVASQSSFFYSRAIVDPPSEIIRPTDRIALRGISRSRF